MAVYLGKIISSSAATVVMERGVMLYGMIGTYKPNGIDQEAYLHHILNVLPGCSCNKIGEFMH
jgi:hypothetical protein